MKYFTLIAGEYKSNLFSGSLVHEVEGCGSVPDKLKDNVFDDLKYFLFLVDPAYKQNS